MSVPITVERIEALLPQTQCGRCGFDGCAPYAEALAAGSVAANRCVPGGEPTLASLAALLGRAAGELDLGGGGPAAWRLAAIDEAECIGCAVCLRACPVDAIVGAAKHMHTVIADHCTGCELCVPVCPVDCIHLVEPCTVAGEDGRMLAARDEGFLTAWRLRQAPAARARHARRRSRLAPAGAGLAGPAASGPDPRRAAGSARKAAIAAAVARARARRASRPAPASPAVDP